MYIDNYYPSAKIYVNFLDKNTYSTTDNRKNLAVCVSKTMIKATECCNSNSKIIENLEHNVGLTIINQRERIMANCFPEESKNPLLIKNYLKKNVDKMYYANKDKFNPVALLYGGSAFDRNVEETDLSCELVTQLEDILKDFGIPTAIITGKYDKDLNWSAFSNKNVINFWGTLCERLRGVAQESPVKISELFEQFFEYVKFSDKDIFVNVPKRIKADFKFFPKI